MIAYEQFGVLQYELLGWLQFDSEAILCFGLRLQVSAYPLYSPKALQEHLRVAVAQGPRLYRITPFNEKARLARQSVVAVLSYVPRTSSMRASTSKVTVFHARFKSTKGMLPVLLGFEKSRFTMPVLLDGSLRHVEVRPKIRSSRVLRNNHTRFV